MTAVDNNLRAIVKIAARQNISLPPMKNFGSFKNNTHIKGVETDNKMNRSDLLLDGSNKDEKINVKYEMSDTCEAGSSQALDFVPINQEEENDYKPDSTICPLRPSSNYKYGYNDIITGTFNDKLEECIARGISINFVNAETENVNTALCIEYEDMLQSNGYKSMLKFREKLPAYVKANEILEVIEKNQVIVISGETGCGKSTQVSGNLLRILLKYKKKKKLFAQPWGIYRLIQCKLTIFYNFICILLY